VEDQAGTTVLLLLQDSMDVQNKKRVLVVDDEESQRSGLARMIAAWGYAVGTAADGMEALEHLGENEVNAVVSDMMMPRMDGTELLRNLRSQGGAPPVIMLTAFGNIETALSTMHELGAFWFLEKPIQPPVLRFLLERARRTRSQKRPNACNDSCATRACWARWWGIRSQCRRFSASSNR
jgi:DNA-binding NtrC family response regulator